MDSSFFRRHLPLLKSWAIFVSALALMLAVSEWRSDWVNVLIPRWTAQTTGWALSALGQKATVNGVIVSCSKCTFEIIGECTAFFPGAILVAAILASPCVLRSKLVGLGLGIPALYLINLVRLVSLCFIYRSYPQAFEMVHLLVWQSLMIFLTILLWIIWFTAMARSGEPRAAEASAR